MLTRWMFISVFAFALSGSFAHAQTGTWEALKNPQPVYGTALLLTDGSVMVLQDYGTACYRLKPDASGSYANGTWTALASMNDSRLYFASVVMNDGRVLVGGGEYGTGKNHVEIYDPVANTWTRNNTWPNLDIGDSTAKVLPTGKVLLLPRGGGYWIYDPAANTWTKGLAAKGGNDEQSVAQLPDGSFFVPWNAASTRYVPSLDTWISTGSPPNPLIGAGSEIGPATLLYDGTVFCLGANGKTDLYTPPATLTGAGTWTAGPPIPSSLMCDDAPAAVMPNGRVLFVADPGGFSSGGVIFEYDPVAKTYTNAGGPAGAPAYTYRMLVLPNGQVLLPENGQLYTPVGSPSAAWQPVVTSITANADGSFKVTGRQLNGLTEGAYYGDDAQMSSNYPLVRLVSGSSVYYAKTSGFSTMGVATGAAAVSANFSIAGIPNGNYSLYAVANGIASSPVAFSVGSSKPFISSALAENAWLNTAFNYSITGTHTPTSFSASGLPAGLAVNTSTGVISGKPTVSGTSNVTISATNAAGTGSAVLQLTVYAAAPAITSATTASGTKGYAFNYTITATNAPTSFGAASLPAGLTLNTATGVISGTPTVSGTFSVALSAVNPLGTGTATLHLTINPPVLTSIVVSPSSATVPVSKTRQFTATGKDQFGNALSPQPAFTWTVSGGGTISATGLFTAGAAAGGPFTVKATSGTVSGSAPVTVYVQTLTTITLSPTSATVAVSTSRQFTASAKDQHGLAMSPQPAFTWRVSGGGTVSSTGLFSAGTSAGAYTLTAASGSVSGTASLTVYVPALATITVAPATANVRTSGTRQFTASGKDQYGVVLAKQPAFTWSTTGGGTISTTGLFTAGTAAGGPYTVRAASGSVGGTAAVSVYLQVLTSITVSPTTASVATSGKKQFTASAKDQFAAAMAVQPAFTWTVTGGGTLSTTGLFTAGTTAGGPFTVKAASGSVSGTASVTITSSAPVATGTPHAAPPVITSIMVAQGDQPHAAESITFTAAASSSDGSVLAYAWSFGDGASGSGATVTHAFTAAGTYTATLTVSDAGGLCASQSVTVTIVEREHAAPGRGAAENGDEDF